MKWWGKRKRATSTKPSGTLHLEKLEDRHMMAAIPLASGQAFTFHDADGTQVKVKLVGPGSGLIELENGVLDGAAIDNIVLDGTTGKSKLKITTKGGSIHGTTINELVVTQALNEIGALKQLKAKYVDFIDGGQLVATGGIADVHIRSLGEGASIDIDGNVKRLKLPTVGGDAVVGVAGTLTKLVSDSFGPGSQVIANQLDHLKTKEIVNGAAFDIGGGGLGKATVNHIFNSSIASDGMIGNVSIKGDARGVALASNMQKGSDGRFGTIDDYVTNTAVTGYINFVNLKGNIGASGGGEKVSLVTNGTVGEVKTSRSARLANTQPVVWTQAASQYIPLSLLQASAGATGVPDDQVWIAVFGQEITTPTGDNPPVTTPFDTYYIDPTQLSGSTPILTNTRSIKASSSTPNQPLVPSFTIEDWKNASQAWGSNLAFPTPSPNSQWTGRIVISVGAAVQAQVNTTDGTVSAPSASNTTDPSTGTFYDFLEFTVTNPNTGPPTAPLKLDIDTTQVDSFGLPMQLQIFKPTTNGQNYQFEFTGATTAGHKIITGIADTSVLAKGQPVFGAGIPGGATIHSVDSASQITLNVDALKTSMSTPLRAYTAPQFVTPFTGTTTTGSKTITDIPDTTGLGSGQAVFGTGIPIGATIQSIVNSTPTSVGSITLNLPASASNSGVSLSAFAGGPVGVQALRDDIMLGSTDTNLLQFLKDQVTDGNAQAQAFLQTAAAYPKSLPTAITGVSGSGVPITITTGNTDDVTHGDVVIISGVQGNTAANGIFTVESVDTHANTFTLAGPTGNGSYTSGGTWTTYTSAGRLVSPKDVVEALATAQDPNALNNYYNEAIDAFFLQYLPASESASGHQGKGQTLELVSTAYHNNPITYQGTVTNQGTENNNYALKLTDPTNTDPATYYVYYPWFASTATTTSNAPDGNIYIPKFGLAAPPQWIIDQKWENQSASQMIFACDAVFADDVARKAYDMNPTKYPKGATVLGDLENSISAAFNRGIFLLPASDWGDTTKWFQQHATEANAAGIQPGTYNYWVEYWHQDGLMLSDLAYAFPYDDKFGASTNLNLQNIGLTQITLGNWGETATATTTAFQNFPTSATPGGNVTLTAHVTGSAPSGYVAFFINGIAINASNAGQSPPIQLVKVVEHSGIYTASLSAALPQLPDGLDPHTYTVTAVYSGDADHLPSIAHSPLLVEETMQIQFAAPGDARVGHSIGLTAILPGSTFSGTVQFSISLTDGSGKQDLGGPVHVTNSTPSTTVTIPANLLTFTGDVSHGSDQILNVMDFTDLKGGQKLSGFDSAMNNLFSHGATISTFQNPELYLSQPANESGIVQLTSGGRTFHGTITQGQTKVEGITNLTGLSKLDIITGPGIKKGTTIESLAPGSITLSHTASATQIGASITSNAVGSYPITAVYKPTPDQSISTTSYFSIID